MWAAETDSLDEDRIAVIKLLLTAGADANAIDNVTYLIIQSCVYLIKPLLEY